jgi:ABC-type histidine transport system ATPase subunit
MDLIVSLPLVNIVHRLCVLDLNERTRLHRERSELSFVFSNWNYFGHIFIYFVLAVEEEEAAYERVCKKLRL